MQSGAGEQVQRQVLGSPQAPHFPIVLTNRCYWCVYCQFSVLPILLYRVLGIVCNS